jgi:hypothetical protein
VPTYLQAHIALHCSSTGYGRRLLELIARLAEPLPGDADAAYLHGPRVADLARSIGCSTRYVTTLLGQLNAEPRDGHAVMLMVGWYAGARQRHRYALIARWPACPLKAARQRAAVQRAVQGLQAREKLADYAVRQAESARAAGGMLQ